jgi:hypothetical protein
MFLLGAPRKDSQAGSHLPTGQASCYAVHRNEDIEHHDVAGITKLQQEKTTVYRFVHDRPDPQDGLHQIWHSTCTSLEFTPIPRSAKKNESDSPRVCFANEEDKAMFNCR